VRLRRDDLTIDNDAIEVLIINSYNGKSSLTINLGVYRFVCSNGLIAGSNLFSNKIRHVGTDFYEQVDYAITRILISVAKLKKVITKLKSRVLTELEVMLYAEHCFNERLRKNDKLFYINLEKSLQRYRHGDAGFGLWEVLNVIQERIIRGGITYTTLEGDETWSAVVTNRTKKLSSIPETTRLNEFVFDAALKLVA
jgi:hypothetical protein